MKILLLLLLGLSTVFAQKLSVFENSYHVITLSKPVLEISVGNKELLSLTTTPNPSTVQTSVKVFGKKAGHSSFLVTYHDGSYEMYEVEINQNMVALEHMIAHIAPDVSIKKSGASSVVLSGEFHEAKAKEKVLTILTRSGIAGEALIDLSQVRQASKMIRTKLYLVEINNNKAKDLGGVTGLGIFKDTLNLKANPSATNGATFSGFLLDNAGSFSDVKGNSLVGTLNFLEEKGVATILDDTILITTEDKNASFHVGGEVYIPVGLTQNEGSLPTIQLQEKKYGLRLTLKTLFSEKKGYMDVNVLIEDSAFDSDKEHNVKLGQYTEVPSFVSKSIQTQIIAQSGQIIALGGRLHSDDYSIEEKVPLLGDVPLLGEAFKHKTSGTKSNDLLFFLVPQIIDPNETLDERAFRAQTKVESKVLHQDFEKETISAHNDGVPVVPIVAEKKRAPEPKEESILKKEEPLILAQEGGIKSYKIAVKKAFIREAPGSQEETTVWSKNHAFQGIEENGWVRITHDCLKNECKEMDVSAWVGRKLIEEN